MAQLLHRGDVNQRAPGIRRAMFVLLTLAAPTAATGQGTSLRTLHAGDTVKVWAVSPRLNGSVGGLKAIRTDSLWIGALDAGRSEAQSTIPIVALRRLEVRRGEHRSVTRIVIGTLVGVGAGALAGGLIGGAAGSSTETNGDINGIIGVLAGGTLGGLLGGIAGGIIGGHKRVPRWQSVSLSWR
jgi:hypothetical protein